MLTCSCAGDYNLVALDYLSKCGLHWVGNCNELNAGMIEKALTSRPKDLILMVISRIRCRWLRSSEWNLSAYHHFWGWRTLGAQCYCGSLFGVCPGCPYYWPARCCFSARRNATSPYTW